jgi:hypothetical protein
LASATRYGPFFAGYWNSLVPDAHGAKHFGSELAAVTTLGGAASAAPAIRNAAARAIRLRKGIGCLLVVTKRRRETALAPKGSMVRSSYD